ncbi:MAG: NfeD family protein [bacterium]|nr:NfeD family protein [bacterium]
MENLFAPENIKWFWIIGGIILMVLELAVPGLIIVFFGAGAVVVGILNWLGLVTGVAESFLAWIVISSVFILLFRKLALKFFPPESSYQLVEEDVDSIGTIVTVVTAIDEKTTEGRIMYNGTSWQAVSNSGTIEAGQKARLLYRDNISWVVELYTEE